MSCRAVPIAPAEWRLPLAAVLLVGATSEWTLGPPGKNCRFSCIDLQGCVEDTSAWPMNLGDFESITSELGIECHATRVGADKYNPSILNGVCRFEFSQMDNKTEDAVANLRCDAEPPGETRRLCPCRSPASQHEGKTDLQKLRPVPAAPSISGLVVSKDGKPSFQGTAEAGARLQIALSDDSGQVVFGEFTKVGKDGHWEAPALSVQALPPGEYMLNAWVMRGVNSRGSRSATQVVELMDESSSAVALKKKPGHEQAHSKPHSEKRKPQTTTTTSVCGLDSRVCIDGTALSRMHHLGCKFPSCPGLWESNAGSPDNVCGDSEFHIDYSHEVDGLKTHHGLFFREAGCTKAKGARTWARKNLPARTAGVNLTFEVSQHCDGDCPEFMGLMVSIFSPQKKHHFYRWCFNDARDDSNCHKKVNIDDGAWYNYVFNFDGFYKRYPGYWKSSLVFELSFRAMRVGSASVAVRTNPIEYLGQAWEWSYREDGLIMSHKNTQYCLRAKEGLVHDDSQVVLGICPSKWHDDFVWRLVDGEPAGAKVFQLAANEQYCLAVRGGADFSDGSPVVLRNCQLGGNGFRWIVEGHHLRNYRSPDYFITATEDTFTGGQTLQMRKSRSAPFRLLSEEMLRKVIPDKLEHSGSDPCENLDASGGMALTYLNTFRCNDRQCVPATSQCNGFRNCDDGQDEAGCDMFRSGERGVYLDPRRPRRKPEPPSAPVSAVHDPKYRPPRPDPPKVQQDTTMPAEKTRRLGQQVSNRQDVFV